MKHRTSETVAGLCFLVLVCSAHVCQAQPATGGLPNSSFEQQRDGRPTGWRTEKWGGDGVFEHARVGRTGQRSVLIASEQGGDIGWAANVAVEPFARYRLSGWIKTENVQVKNGRGALLNLHNMQPVATRALTGTNDWTQVEVVFETEEQDAVQVNCLFGGWGLATGKAWYDDVSLELLSRSPPLPQRITIDAAKTGEPISPYVYGQFIEHMGRCIYGGIWAEMLEDRKFCDPVGAKGSPWKPVGSADAVSMVRQDAFVGQHTPRIALGGDRNGGIAQDALGLIAGKSYVGRIWLAGSQDAGPVQVSLVWGDDPSERQTVAIPQLTEAYAQTPLAFTSGKSTDSGRLEITAAGSGHFFVGTVSLMPADNVAGMRPDTLALLKELDSPVYRWPGGNFVSGYDWRDGIGDRDRRPPRKNPAWTGIEHNDFGLDEFLVFCRELNTEPYIAVNSGLGEVQDAVEELLYANAAPDTPQGTLRAANGHREPYGVKFWGIGNEMYGGWQLGHMSLEKYIEKHNRFAEAMRKADPSIVLVAVGDAGRWSEGMMKHCAEHMDLISEHFYCGEQQGLAGHVRQVPNAVRHKAEAHRRYRQEFESLRGKDIRIALDEWNYWYGPHVFGELGTRYFLKDGLGIAAGLHQMARDSEMFYMANYAQTVNVIGCIKTNKTTAAFETTGLVLKLYRKHFGVVPVAVECSRAIDAVAAWSADRKTLTLAVVNPSLQPAEIPLIVNGAKLAGSGTRWQIVGEDPQAYNDPADPDRIQIEEATVQVGDKVTVGPCSVTLFAFPVE
jgi:alpha-N-arabinofuranosidase